MIDRREAMKGMLAVTAAAAVGVTALPTPTSQHAIAAGVSFGFKEITAGIDETHHVAQGYDADILIRWGDPVLPGAPAFDPINQSAAAQEQQFGYNCDFIGYLPLPHGSDNPNHGLLFVNHEHTNEELMFPGVGRQDRKGFASMTRELVDVEMAVHGATVIEAEKIGGKWKINGDSQYNRRISARSTEKRFSGPAAGVERMKTSADPSGARVIGMISNCAGGQTPWGTFLTAEENFNGYFWNRGAVRGHKEERNLKRYGVPGEWYNWGQHYDRFDIGKEPNEPNRFGWIVEVDPYDPTSTPIKRTALGRFKHEGAETLINKDGRVVCYMGDDQRFDYVYKFVSHGPYDPNNRDANRNLLDSGSLFAARFDSDGSLTWLPLVYGAGSLNEKNGMAGQADVLIETRRAADLVGATPMDRPEDVQPNPVTDRVYVMLTNNTKRKDGDTNATNPRGPNPYGPIVEMTPPGSDHGALKYTWDFLIQCGDPREPSAGSNWWPATSDNGWFQAPDNAAVDGLGRLWVATEGNRPGSHSDRSDGVWAVETAGPMRGTSRHFFRTPIGAELCGPRFTPDDQNLFVSVQHPGDGGVIGT